MAGNFPEKSSRLVTSLSSGIRFDFLFGWARTGYRCTSRYIPPAPGSLDPLWGHVLPGKLGAGSVLWRQLTLPCFNFFCIPIYCDANCISHRDNLCISHCDTPVFNAQCDCPWGYSLQNSNPTQIVPSSLGFENCFSSSHAPYTLPPLPTLARITSSVHIAQALPPITFQLDYSNPPLRPLPLPPPLHQTLTT